MSMTTKDVLQQTDWKLLRKQKVALIIAEGRLLKSGPNEGQHLEGLILWIDAIQDAAVEEGIATDEDVFGGVT